MNMGPAIMIYKSMQRTIDNVRKWEQSSECVPLEVREKNVEERYNAFKERVRAITCKRDKSYYVLHMTYKDFMEDTQPQIMEVPKDLFDSICEHDTDYGLAMAEMLKSENKQQPTRIFGISEVYISSEGHVRKGLFAVRDYEDIADFDLDGFERLFKLKFPHVDASKMRECMEFMQKNPDVARLIIGDRVPSKEFVEELNLNTRTCSSCERRGIKLDMCSKCQNAWYCNTTCQKTHWKVHKMECKQKI